MTSADARTNVMQQQTREQVVVSCKFLQEV